MLTLFSLGGCALFRSEAFVSVEGPTGVRVSFNGGLFQEVPFGAKVPNGTRVTIEIGDRALAEALQLTPAEIESVHRRQAQRIEGSLRLTRSADGRAQLWLVAEDLKRVVLHDGTLWWAWKDSQGRQVLRFDGRLVIPDV